MAGWGARPRDCRKSFTRSYLKVPNCEIFDPFDFRYFYRIKSRSQAIENLTFSGRIMNAMQSSVHILVYEGDLQHKKDLLKFSRASSCFPILNTYLHVLVRKSMKKRSCDICKSILELFCTCFPRVKCATWFFCQLHIGKL